MIKTFMHRDYTE